MLVGTPAAPQCSKVVHMNNIDQIACDSAREIMELVSGKMPVGGLPQLQAMVQNIVVEAMQVVIEQSNKETDILIDRLAGLISRVNKKRLDAECRLNELTSEIETAKQCLPYYKDKKFAVAGSWIGSTQNYIASLEEKLKLYDDE